MTTTFRHLHVADSRRRIEVEVGDAKQPDFFPQLKTLHWGGEAAFSVRLVDDRPHVRARVTRANETVEWRKPHRAAKWYPLDPEAGLLEDGGHEFEVHLFEPPTSNVLKFTVRAKGLRFYFQPPLTAEEVEEGASRPENVVGSYAVYHESKAGNFDDVHYRAGKAFHILRPHAVDDTGLRAWCDISIPEDGNGEATITVPQAFLEMAAFPVVVDPTFGYTTIGGSSTTLAVGAGSVCLLHTPLTASGGETITDLNAYGGGSGGTGAFDMAVYTINGTPSPVNRLATPVNITYPNITLGWRTASGLSQVTAAATYGPAVGNISGPGDFSSKFDTGSGSERSAATTTTLATPWSESGRTATIYSMYATYTAAPPALVPTPIVVPSQAAQRASSW